MNIRSYVKLWFILGRRTFVSRRKKTWLEYIVVSLRKELDDKRKKGLSTPDLKKENI